MQVKYQGYNLQFTSPVNFFGKMLLERTGLIISIAESERNYYADITFFDSISEIEILTQLSLINEFFSSGIDRSDYFDSIKKVVQVGLKANFMFGINSILLDMYIDKMQFDYDLSQLKSYPFLQSIDDLKYYDITKIYSAKLKFNGSLEECDAINEVFSRYGIKFRLDFNRKFSLEQSQYYFGQLTPEAIEYVEEPCTNPSDIQILKSESTIPIAIDESLIRKDVQQGILDIADCFIIKPSLIGDFNYIDFIANYALTNSKRIVFSSAYESPIGIRSLRQLACFYGLRNQLMGFDTAKLIKSINYF